MAFVVRVFFLIRIDRFLSFCRNETSPLCGTASKAKFLNDRLASPNVNSASISPDPLGESKVPFISVSSPSWHSPDLSDPCHLACTRSYHVIVGDWVFAQPCSVKHRWLRLCKLWRAGLNVTLTPQTSKQGKHTFSCIRSACLMRERGIVVPAMLSA